MKRRRCPERIKSKLVALFFVILTINWFTMFSFVPVAQALSLVEIEVFTNQESTNTSNTDYNNPLVFDNNITSYDVDFIVEGEKGVQLDLLNTKKQVVLVVPKELENKVEVRDTAKVEVNVLLSESAPIIGPLLTTILGLLGKILNLVDELLPLAKEINELLKKLVNLGVLEYEAAIENNGTYLVIDYEEGLVRAIVSNLKDTVQKLNVALDKLSKLPIVGILVKGLVDQVLAELVKLIDAIDDPLSNTADILANTSILSNTKVTFPTTIHDPGEDLYGDQNGIVETTFAMNIVQAGIIDLELFKSSTSTSKVYLQGKKSEMNTALNFPGSLNFGVHEIQTLYDETWLATATGNQQEAPSTGSVSLTDTTVGEKTWAVKVKQVGQWLNNNQSIGTPILRMYGGDLLLTGFLDTDVITPFTAQADYIDISYNDEKEIIRLNETTAQGTLELDIDKFELFVPSNYAKKSGVYEAQFVWTASNTP